MDIWSPESQRHKRSFTEMSHPATLSPSPMNFGDPSTSNFFSHRYSRAPSNENLASVLDRRRTSHPHNQHLQRASEEMPARSHSQQRPRLEHRASQTIIDLTDEPEELPLPSRNDEERSRSQRPPQLGRSDAVSLGDFIDLTDDNGEPDIIIMGGRQLPLPRPSAARPVPPARRDDSPSLFVPLPPQPINRVFPTHRHGVVIGVSGRVERRGRIPAEAEYHIAARMGQEIMDHIQAFHDEQVMPGLMNYQHHAFVDRKPQHVAPPAAKEGFTRSPEESQTIICPSCEEELIHRKDEEPIVKKGGKAPSRKDREEHPFWVVKECGHVYCNSCFQNRAQSGKYGAVSFRASSKPPTSSKSKTTKLLCSVDDCESDIRNKDKWVGVFL
ncbi:uncharacterized protein K444DRAFT_424354 [Hyaloscypha bicolor E]|uniref:Cell cycle control protein n=1 Tax=Hyaloscypha bicolor E TaxID=1095630 RepID=A0A2J6T7X4_9HELO|nr:uncharacterized protein K444DRAFT_424354 [Hyaloscypha bicolor E]PMD59119.1 hypothetical protein K444DRAFT_424354 [Hyaloscypha bicolor E]